MQLAIAINICNTESHEHITARLRQYVKQKKFELRNFGTYGLENKLYARVCIQINKVIYIRTLI